MKKKAVPELNLCDICLCINSYDRYDEVMSKIVQRATEIVDLKGAMIRLLDKKGQALEIASYYGLSRDYVEKGPMMLDKSSIDREAITEGRTVFVANAQKDKRILYPDKVKEEKITSVICAPLKTPFHTLGVIKGYASRQRRFTQDEIALFEKLAGQAAVAIENLKALERDKILLEISRKVNSSLDLSNVLQTTVKLAAESMKLKAATIRLLDENKHKMVLKAAWGLSEKFLEYGPYDLSDLPIDQEVLAGKTIYIPVVTEDTRFIFPEFAKQEGIVSALCVPLQAMERTFGTLRIYTATEYQFSEDEKNFLLTLANQAAIAVNNAILYNRLHTLFLVSTSLSKSLDIHQVFKTITEGATKATNAQGCALLLWDSEFNRFSLEESYGVSKEFLTTIKENYVDQSKEILCGERVITSRLECELDQKCLTVASKEGINSFINIPMKSKEHLTGILQCYFFTTRDFTDDEIEFFYALANEAAVAIENAKLYDAINKKYNHLVEDIFLWYDGTYKGMDD
ncbi:MAG: GAF domain-containing protein [Candidatus Eremiobacteraeota bacterium]|nr:GAF domain-containing protein [Candidatus Eremiobacteraeota bacterium]